MTIIACKLCTCPRLMSGAGPRPRVAQLCTSMQEPTSLCSFADPPAAVATAVRASKLTALGSAGQSVGAKLRTRMRAPHPAQVSERHSNDPDLWCGGLASKKVLQADDLSPAYQLQRFCRQASCPKNLTCSFTRTFGTGLPLRYPVATNS
jgi:hypothetical protein